MSYPATHPQERCASDGSTALAAACQFRIAAAVVQLLAAKAVVDCRDERQMTPLGVGEHHGSWLWCLREEFVQKFVVEIKK